MIDFEGFDNKKFVYSCLNLLNEKGCLNEGEIQILTSEDECKRLFVAANFLYYRKFHFKVH